MPRNDFANSQDLVEIKRIEKNTLQLVDGSLRQILMVSGVNFALKSERDQELIVAAYQNLLNSLDFSIQVLIHSRKINISKYLEQLNERRKTESSPLLQSQISEYRKFIKEFVHDNAIMQKTFFVVIPWHPAGARVASSATKSVTEQISKLFPFGKKDSKEEDSKEEDVARAAEERKIIEQALPQLNRRVAQVEEGVRAIGLNAVLLDDEQLIELIYNFYNPENAEREGITIPEERTTSTDNK